MNRFLTLTAACLVATASVAAAQGGPDQWSNVDTTQAQVTRAATQGCGHTAVVPAYVSESFAGPEAATDASTPVTVFCSTAPLTADTAR